MEYSTLENGATGFFWIEFDALWNESQTQVMTNMLARGVERKDGLSCSRIGEGARRGVGIGGVAAEGAAPYE
jgi:hypothetical protein